MRILNYIRDKMITNRGLGKLGIGSKIYGPAMFSCKENIFIADDTTILNHSRLQSFGNRAECPSAKIKIGTHCYIGYNFTILAGETVTLGDDVLIASNVLISSENHSINPESNIPYMDQELQCMKVEIGDGCWIGEKAIILPGVVIGKKSIIGAGSIVTKSIPEYSIAVGSPARVVKKYNFKSHEWEKVA